MRGTGAIVLAAGGSRRFGAPKQLLEFEGASLIRRAVGSAIGGGCDPVVVVVGAIRDQLINELRELRVEIADNAHWEQGLGTSIRCGLRHLLGCGRAIDGVVLLACDQPLVDARCIGDLIATAERSGKPIAASRYAGTLGIPAFFSGDYFERLQALADESGAKSLIASNAADVAEIAFEGGAIDIDTPADFRSLSEESG